MVFWVFSTAFSCLSLQLALHRSLKTGSLGSRGVWFKSLELRGWGSNGVAGLRFLKDQMTLKSRGPIPIYYESLYDI